MAEVEQETQAEEAQPDDAPTDAPVVGAIGESDAETAQTTEEAELVHKVAHYSLTVKLSSHCLAPCCWLAVELLAPLAHYCRTVH